MPRPQPLADSTGRRNTLTTAQEAAHGADELAGEEQTKVAVPSQRREVEPHEASDAKWRHITRRHCRTDQKKVRLAGT